MASQLSKNDRNLPKWMENVIQRMIKDDDRPLENIIGVIQNRLTDGFYLGEKVQLTKPQGERITGEIVTKDAVTIVDGSITPTNRNGKENAQQCKEVFKYGVKLDKKNKLVANVPASELVRCGYIPSRSSLRNYINNCATYERTGNESEFRWILNKVDPSPKKVGYKQQNSSPDKPLQQRKRKQESEIVPAAKEKKASPLKPLNTPNRKSGGGGKGKSTSKNLTLSEMWSKGFSARSAQKPEVKLVRLGDEEISRATTPVKVTPNAQTTEIKKPEVKLQRLEEQILTIDDVDQKPEVKSQHLNTKMIALTVSPLKDTTATVDEAEVQILGTTNTSNSNKKVVSRIRKPAKVATKGTKVTTKRKPKMNSVCLDDEGASKRATSKKAWSKRTSKTNVRPNSFASKVQRSEVVLLRLDSKAIAEATTPVKNASDNKVNTGHLKEFQMKQMTLIEMSKARMNACSSNAALGASIQLTLSHMLQKTQITTNGTAGLGKQKRVVLDKLESQILKPAECLRPLPTPKLMATPPGFENEWIGDCIMIVQFVSTYRMFLLPQNKTLTTDLLIKALVSGTKGISYLIEIIVCLLRILTQNIRRNCYELGVLPSEIPVTAFTASELIILSFPRAYNLSKEVRQCLNWLQTKDFHDMEPYEKLKIMSELCNEAMARPELQQYVEEHSLKVNKAWSRFRSIAKELKGLKLKEMLQTSSNNEESDEAKPPDVVDSATNFYGHKEHDLKSAVESRRKSAQEARKSAEVAREQRAKEAKRARMEHDYELARKQASGGDDNKKLLKKFSPLGIDRDMTRYWYVQHFAPGLVLEKGWLHDRNSDEKNQWFYYDNFEDVEMLLNNLSGFHENELSLRTELKKVQENVKRCLSSAKDITASNAELPVGSDDPLGELKEELIDVGTKICKSTIGTLEDLWTDRVLSAQNCSEFYPCFLELFECIREKFRTGMLKKKEVVNGTALGLTKVNSKEADLWLKEVKRCESLSRLHVLLAIFSNATSLTLNMRCSLCRCKNINRKFLVCSECGKGFHASCVMIDPGDDTKEWKCFTCCRLRPRNEKKVIHDGDGSEDEEEEEEDDSDDNSQDHNSDEEEEDAKVTCCKCKVKDGDNCNDLVVCSDCRKAYHTGCHNPPLRRCPRGQWKCGKCTDLDSSESESKKSGKKTSFRNKKK